MSAVIELPHKDINGITYYLRDTGTQNIYARFYIKGKRYKFSTGKKSVKDASVVAIKKFTDINSGRLKKSVTYYEAFQDFIKTKIIEEKAPVTIEGYERIGKHCVEFFGKKIDITEIDNSMILGLRYWRKNYYKNQPEKKRQRSYTRGGKKVKGYDTRRGTITNTTVNKTTSFVSMVIRHAWRNMDCGIQESDLPTVTPLQEEERDYFIKENEFRELYRYFWDRGLKYHAYVSAFVFYTACRYPSEINRLKWRDINFDEEVILVRNRKTKRVKSLDTIVPMLKETQYVLQGMKFMAEDAGRELSGDDFVFVNEKGIQIKNIRKSFKKAVRECGLDSGLTMYSLRHSAITNWLMSYPDIPLKIISEICGHEDTKMIDKIYAKIGKSDAANRFKQGVEQYDYKFPNKVPVVENPDGVLDRLERIGMVGEKY